MPAPYQEKELAKALGARWDTRRTVWYVIDLNDLTPFAKWLPQPARLNHRADSYVLLESRRNCWKCGRTTRVFGFALLSGHEQLEKSRPDLEFPDDDDYDACLEGLDAMRWVVQDAPAVLL